MSGHFTQRGEPALVDKWARAEMALRGGADAVFEIPTLFAVRDAEHFALGGVSLLEELGVVTDLSFGSETGDLDALRALSQAEEDQGAIREALDKGQTLARARGIALSRPNDLLGVEYLRALEKTDSAITPHAILRADGGHAGAESASAIRKAIRAGEDVLRLMPPSAYALLGRVEHHREAALDTALLALLRAMPPQALQAVADVSEGLEFRLLRAAQEAGSREELLRIAKCKRYTHARLSRILTQALLGIDKSLVAAFPAAPYARLLGFRRDAAPLLRAVHERARIPIVTRPARFRAQGGRAFALDIRAGDLWALGCDRRREGRRDLTTPLLILE